MEPGPQIAVGTPNEPMHRGPPSFNSVIMEEYEHTGARLVKQTFPTLGFEKTEAVERLCTSTRINNLRVTSKGKSVGRAPECHFYFR